MLFRSVLLPLWLICLVLLPRGYVGAAHVLKIRNILKEFNGQNIIDKYSNININKQTNFDMIFGQKSKPYSDGHYPLHIRRYQV